MDEPKVGERIVLCGSSPWAGYGGEVVSDRATVEGRSYPVVELDNGFRSVVFRREQWRRP